MWQSLKRIVGMACSFSNDESAAYPPRSMTSSWCSKLKAFGLLRIAEEPRVTPAATGVNENGLATKELRAPRLHWTTSARSPFTLVQWMFAKDLGFKVGCHSFIHCGKMLGPVLNHIVGHHLHIKQSFVACPLYLLIHVDTIWIHLIPFGASSFLLTVKSELKLQNPASSKFGISLAANNTSKAHVARL